MTDKIVALRWRLFIKSLESTTMSIIRELYANFPNIVDYKEMVRGVLLPFGASVINSFYRMRDI